MSNRFVITDKVGLRGRVSKSTTDVQRTEIDFVRWLDDDESIGAVSQFSLLVDTSNPLATAWQTDYPFDPTAEDSPIEDTTPLILVGATITGTTANILVGAGTPGITYIVSFVARGATSGREKEVDFLVTIAEQVNSEMISSLDPTPAETTTVVAGTIALDEGLTGTIFVENAAAAAITITLPPSPTLNQTLDCVDASGNAATYTIHWEGDSGALINGAATYDFSLDYQSASFRWNGTQWIVV